MASFKIWIKDFMRGKNLVTQQTLMQEIPAESEGSLRLINPIVKNEMGNAETFEFSIEAGTKFYDAFLQMKTFILVKYDNDTIFYGRVIAISNNSFRQTRKIRCEGAFAFFLDSPVEGVEEAKRPSITVNQYMSNLIANHNSYMSSEPNKKFTLGNVPNNYSNSISSEQQIPNESRAFGADSWTDTKGALEDLRSHYGGYFRTRLSGDIGTSIYLDWMDQYFKSSKNKQKIKVGKNILDISNDLELENIFTAIIPIGRRNVPSGTSDGKSTGVGQTDNLYLSGNKLLRVPDIVSVYGNTLNFGYHTRDDYEHAIDRYGMIIKTVTFQEADTEEKLRQQACAWIKNNYQGEVKKFTIKAIDMHQIGENTDKIMVGDRVDIVYRIGDENGVFSDKEITQTCLSINYDLYHPENNSYTFGVPANILTKTYGVKKQARGKSDTGITSPPHASSGGGDGGQEKKWINVVAGWLMRHKLHYGGPKPYNEDEHGNSFQSGEYMLRPSAHLLVKAQVIWYATIAGQKSPIVDRHGNPLEKPWDKTVSAWIKEMDLPADTVISHAVDTRNAGFASYSMFDEATVYDFKVCEYVLSEYGIDLRTCLEVKAPKTITTHEGEEITFNEEVNEETGLPEYVKASITDGHKTGKLGPDGEEIVSIQDEDGNWHYFYQTKSGEIIETSIRELSIESLDSKKKVGWVVTENQDGTYDLNPETMPGQITTAIENRLNGEVVVTRVSGEEMYLGNKSTQFITQTSVQHMDSVCGMVDYTPDPNDPTRKLLYVRSGGGMRVWHAKMKPDQTGYEVDEQGRIKYSTFGLYDENTLNGGMLVEKLADGTVHTTISGDIVDIQANQVKVGNNFANVEAWLTQNGIDIDDLEGLVTDTITAYEGYFRDINANKIDAGNINAKLESVQTLTVRNIIGVDTTQAASTSRFGSYYGDHYYIQYATGPDSSETIDLKQSVAHANITRSGNIYTLNLYTATGLRIEPRDGDEMTFSRAVTSYNFTGPGDGQKYTITPNPQGGPDLEFYLQAPIDYTPTIVAENEKLVKARIQVMKPNTEGQPTEIGYSEININATRSWTKGQDSGKTIGWDAARGKLDPPAEGTSSSFAVKIPAADYNGQSEYDFTLSVDNNYAYVKNGLNKNVARVTNSAYGNGWDAARGKLVAPAEGTTSSFTVKIPASTVNQQSEYNFTLHENDTYAYVRNAANKTIARISNDAYGNGWDAAYKKCSNAAEGTGTSFSVKIPASTAGQQSEYAFSLSADSSYAYVKNALSKTVAQVSISSSPSYVTIDIPTAEIDIDYNEPSGTKLTQLKGAIQNAISLKMFVHFKVTAGSSSKVYYMDFR